MKMKKGLKITKAFLIIFILVSTVSLLPVVNAEATTPKYDLSGLRVVKNQLIEKLGKEKYQEIEENVSRIIQKQFPSSITLDFDSPLYELLKEIAVIIVAVMVLLFGNNPVGVGLGSFVCVILLSIPVLLVAVGVTVYDLLNFVEGTVEPDIREIIEQFGIIGMLILFVLLVPILIILLAVFLIIDIPLSWGMLMLDLIWYAQSY